MYSALQPYRVSHKFQYTHSGYQAYKVLHSYQLAVAAPLAPLFTI